MNTHDTNRPVRDFAVEIPGATRLFERIGIDYCCGGAKALDEACAERGLDAAEILRSLEGLEFEADHGADDAATWSLAALADHIVETHHAFTREELVRLDRLFDKVAAAHGARHAELHEMRDLFCALAAELVPHMLKEEQVLFPFIKQLEQAAALDIAPPVPFFGTVRNPVHRMSLEHDSAGELLAKMRALGGDYTPPADACISYRTLFEALDGLERDLHVHIHLENNILFPKAVALEAAER